MKARDVSVPGAALQVHELSLEPPVRDITNDADRWFPEPVSLFEVVVVSFFVSVCVDAVIVGGIVAIAVVWSAP